MVHTYQQADSYVDNAQYHERFVRRDTGLEYDVPSHSISVVFERPNRVRIDRQVPPTNTPGLAASVTSNGTIVRAYVSDYTDQVLEHPAPETFTLDETIIGQPLRDALLPVPLENLYPQLDMLLSSDQQPPRLLAVGPAKRIESAELEGARCYRVEITQPAEGTRTLWIDETTLLLRRMEMPTEAVKALMDSDNVLRSLELWIDFHDASFAVSPDAATFEMSVPDSAVRVRELIPPPAALDPALGKSPEGYTFTGLDGEPVTSESLAEQVVVLDFWFTGCEPCRRSVPALEALFQHYQSGGQFRMIAVSVDPEHVPAKAIEKTLRQWGGSMPIVRDLNEHGAEYFQVEGWPTTILLGPAGKVQQIARGGMHGYEPWHELIDALLAGGDPVAETLANRRREVAVYKAQVAAAAINDSN
jgi:thiol-disulfide isomerase/thioredoxin